MIPLQFMHPPLHDLHMALVIRWWFLIWALLTAYWILSPCPYRQELFLSRVAASADDHELLISWFVLLVHLLPGRAWGTKIKS